MPLVKTTINEPAVTDVQKAQAVLSKYAGKGIALTLDENGSLILGGDFDEFLRLCPFFDDPKLENETTFDLPLAVLAEQLPDRSAFKDEDEWYEAERNFFDKEGYRGFEALLCELSPLLKTQLLILVLKMDTDNKVFSTRVWSVSPGADTEVLNVVSP